MLLEPHKNLLLPYQGPPGDRSLFTLAIHFPQKFFNPKLLVTQDDVDFELDTMRDLFAGTLPTELGACVTDVATCLFEDPSCVDLACDLCNHLGESSTHVALRAG